MPGRSITSGTDVLIIGAGPAGLSLGYELKQRGIECCLLEEGSAAGHSWATMPDSLKLVSPWKANWLPGMNRRSFPPNYQMAASEYAGMLQRHSRHEELQIITKACVEDVHSDESGFVVRSSAGTIHAPLLVNATGCFKNPFTPEITGAREAGVPQVHFAGYQNVAAIRNGLDGRTGLVLVVGKRLSAGQVLLELADAGLETALSCRGPIRFGAGPVGNWLFFRIHPALERLELRLRGPNARGFPAVMPGGRTRRLIEQEVRIVPEIARFENKRVVFTDGTVLEPGAVVYATGFRPALGHLASLKLKLPEATGLPQLRNFESVTVPGLFFLGLDGMRNFRSRFIRGIREDAPILAEELVGRVKEGRRKSPATDRAPQLAEAGPRQRLMSLQSN